MAIPSAPTEHPPAADLRAELAKNPLPIIPPGTVDADALTGEVRTKIAKDVLTGFNAALAAADSTSLARCFYPAQAYWKDALALTWHLRTFSGAAAVAAALLRMYALRGIEGGVRLEGEPYWIPISPVLHLFDCSLSFKTTSPAAECKGRMLLLPVKEGETIEWKIWCFSTWVDGLSSHPEDEGRLRGTGRQVEGPERLETDVFIIGGGNAAASLAARLKALGVDSIMADRNARPGDNWALRYDALKFHVPTQFCDMAYLPYEKHKQYPHLLSRDDLAEQVRRYVETFHLNVISSATVRSTTYDPSAQRWTVQVQTPGGQQTVVSKHLVQATGYGSQKPYVPAIADRKAYQGISVHSSEFKNAEELKARGVKSVLIIGSANTAFDILTDCHSANLHTTLVARSPTYVVPLSHICDPRGLGAYSVFGSAGADRIFMTLPQWVDAGLAVGLFSFLSSQEPDRYSALAKAGFPVIDGAHPDACLSHNLLERAGGHYVDIGGTDLIAQGKVGVKAGAEPVAYTAKGLRFSDGDEVEADAVVWCTGFADKNARDVAAEVLGAADKGNGNGEVVQEKEGKTVLGPREIADRLDATWGIDGEGEVRGMWKRHARMENYWTMGGHTQHHRWHSKTVALQIKAALEGILPPAYRETPEL
ncbi:hypothetical protein VTJ49DRAFT_666 [Mycothermus thermophilus]|uniref:FAD/NAD(P)-binding domain-containing protein n=1 Tax=Humicola insolens TaxID=85995 RepID=A0ABR3VF36_HUMIN